MGRWMDTETELMLDTTPTVYVRTIDAAEIMEQAANAGVKLDSDATLYAIHDENGHHFTRDDSFCEKTGGLVRKLSG